jgi:aminoglycoside 3-N-acetyltransferase
MGILPTDTVLIHTSMRAIGEVENGADGVIDAFLEVLQEGLFLVPTHTWSSVHPGQPVYDVSRAIPCIGALPRAAAFRKDGIRSLHPTHSIWASGVGAAAFVKNEENAPTPGYPGFAWERLGRVSAKILLIGVGHDKNTYIHAVEELADVPDRLASTPYSVEIIDREMQHHSHDFRGHYCSRSHDVSAQFGNFEPALIALGAQKLGKLGNATVRIVDAQKCRDIILKIYSHAQFDPCIEACMLPTSWYME